MKRKLLFFALLLTSCCLQAQTSKIFVENSYSKPTGISPNGKYAVGQSIQTQNVSYLGLEITGYESYLWDLEEDDIQWLTSADFETFDNTGNFAAVNNDGIIAGHRFYVEYLQEQLTNVATVWENGKVTELGLGDYSLYDFGNPSDGTFATCISEDGKTIGGYVSLYAGLLNHPCVWKYDENTEKWDFEKYTLPQGTSGGRITGMAADGKIFTGELGMMSLGSNFTKAVIWTSRDEYVLLEDEERKYGASCMVTENGKLAYGLIFDLPGLGGTRIDLTITAYDTENKSFGYIVSDDIISTTYLKGASNNGDLYGYNQYALGLGVYYTQPFVYKEELGIIYLDNYMKTFAPDVILPDNISFDEESRPKAFVQACSADGNKIMGYNVTDSGNVTWILQIEENNNNNEVPVVAGPGNFSGKVTGFRQALLTWDIPDTEIQNYEYTGYNIYRDGKVIAFVEGKEKTTYTDSENVPAGLLAYSVTSVYQSIDKTKEGESLKSDVVRLAMADTYSLPFYDNFDRNILDDENFWTREGTGIKDWNIGMMLGLTGNGLCVSTTSEEAYSESFISRYMDASDHTTIYLSYFIRNFFSGERSYEDNSTLHIEISTGEDNWHAIKTYSLNREGGEIWFNEFIDLVPYVNKGETFRIRFRADGNGKGGDISFWSIDNVRVDTQYAAEKIQGIRGAISNDKVNIIWKGRNDNYQLSYLTNQLKTSPSIMTAGNAGASLIIANSFDIDQLAPYRGLYINSITTRIQQQEEGGQETRIAIVIYENNQPVRREIVNNIEFNAVNTFVLENPYRIEGDKELKIGLELIQHDPQNFPLCYQSLEYFGSGGYPGKSNLYSEDAGESWNTFREYCIWEVAANLSENSGDPTGSAENYPLSYQVYRNGIPMSEEIIFYDNPWFRDENPLEDAVYSVRSFYFNAEVSDIIEITMDEIRVMTGIEERKIKEKNCVIYPNPATDYIIIGKDFKEVSILNAGGQLLFKANSNPVSVSGLPEGIYMLIIRTQHDNYMEKVIIRK